MTELEGQCNSTYSTRQRNCLILATGVSASVSVLVCVIAIVMVLRLTLYKSFTYRLATYQVLGSLLQSVAMSLHLMLFNYSSEELYYQVTCYFTASFVQFAMWVKLMFTLWLTFHLFVYVVFLKNAKKLECLYLCSSVLVSVIVAAIPFFHDAYGIAGAWCYIRSWEDDCAEEKFTLGIVEQFVLYFGPATLFLALSVAAILVMLAVIVRRMLRNSYMEPRLLASGGAYISRNNYQHALKQLLPLLAYPVIFFTLLLCSLVNRIYMAASMHVDFELIMAQAISQASMGLCAGLALIVHLCFLKKGNSGTSRNQRTDNDATTTYASITPISPCS